MDNQVEHEICANCKKEIPHYNYVMHTAHCSRNITLCQICKEPVPKSQYEEHKKQHKTPAVVLPKPKPPPLKLEENDYFKRQREIEDKKVFDRKQRYLERHEKFVGKNYTLGSSSDTTVSNSTVNFVAEQPKQVKIQHDASSAAAVVSKPKKAPSDLIPCKYCELELPKLELGAHEDYCGARTDKCQECGELVMFKYKQLHEDTNHGFLKLKDEPGPRPSWESNAPINTSVRRRRPSPLRTFSAGFDLPILSPPPVVNNEKRESYKEISRRLDCKTEYIRNLLHDSASITVPLRSNGAVPRNHFNHNKGPAPQPPRRRNPPTELEIPCEFCGLSVPHQDLIQHESGCRPDLARFNPRRRSPSPDYFIAPPPSSPEVELPCEFCCDMIPASQLLRHQATCV